MQTDKELTLELICNAESGNHRQFQYISSWQEYSRTKKIRRGHMLLVASIRKSADKLFKSHCKSIIENNSDACKLIAYCTTLKILKFYEEELQTLTDMIIEYECYLANGNWADFLFGDTRPADKLYDHRSL